MLQFDDSIKLNCDFFFSASPHKSSGRGGYGIKRQSADNGTYVQSILGKEGLMPLQMDLTRIPGDILGLSPDRTVIVLKASLRNGQFPFKVYCTITGLPLLHDDLEDSHDDDTFLPVQDREIGDFVIYPRVVVLKMRGRTNGASGIFVFRWGMAALSDKPAARFISKIYDNTNCDIFAKSPDSTTMILCPHGSKYILEYQDIGGMEMLPWWEYPIPHFTTIVDTTDEFLKRWWVSCALAEAERLLFRATYSHKEQENMVELSLQEMPQVPEEIRQPNDFARDAIGNYIHEDVDTKIVVDCDFVYVLLYATDKNLLWISYGIVGQQGPFQRVGPLECEVFIRRALCCNFGHGDASALFLIPSLNRNHLIHLSCQRPPGISFVGKALKTPSLMARDLYQGIITDEYRVYYSSDET